MEDLTLIKFKVTEDRLGYPEPFIPDGSIVLLIQEGNIQFSLYREATEKNGYPTLIHPRDREKNIDLELEVKELIAKMHPEYLLSRDSIVLTCPNVIEKKIVWEF